MKHVLKIILISALPSSILVIIVFVICLCRNRVRQNGSRDVESSSNCKEASDEIDREELTIFEGVEDLTVFDILDAPGEVIGKSSYGTLYRASLIRNDSVMVLRFLRPTCTEKISDFWPVIKLLGSIRHPNLVPLSAFYAGQRGERLLVHPFYRYGNLAEFIRDGKGESHRWTIINRISIGIARGLDHLHTSLQKPIIHGNLKSKNVLLSRNFNPYISDFGLHLLLNPTAGQEILEDSLAEGYKAPELIKMKETSEKSDIYSFGVILLELITGKEPMNDKPHKDEDFYLPNAMRNAILGNKIMDLYHPDVLGRNSVSEEGVLKFIQLAISCCSPSPSIRPDTRQIIKKLEEFGE